jgi:hypothetical protein
MTARESLTLPLEAFRLEELNLPPDLARTLVGKTVEVEVWPEELPHTRRLEPGRTGEAVPFQRDPDGSLWNDYCPIRVNFGDTAGKMWRLPRRWVEAPAAVNEPYIDSFYPVSQEVIFSEGVHLPSVWDLLEINIPIEEAVEIGGQQTVVEVRLAPHEPVKVFWRDSNGRVWRIPHNWRRRRIRLPGRDVLVSQGVPDEVAERFGNQAVSVNFHPGSLCCLEEQYRFRDEEGNRWPVYIRDCTILGFGDAAEHHS